MQLNPKQIIFKVYCICVHLNFSYAVTPFWKSYYGICLAVILAAVLTITVLKLSRDVPNISTGKRNLMLCCVPKHNKVVRVRVRLFVTCIQFCMYLLYHKGSRSSSVARASG